MYVRNIAATALLFCAVRVLAQTPDDDPSLETDNSLGVTYGDTAIVAGTEYPQALAQQQPSINTDQPAPGPYMLVMLDLSLPRSRVNGTGDVAPGIGDDRTTRLHWLQTNLTVGDDGLVSVLDDTPAAANYAGPQPPQGDIPHVYAWYLFTQPDTFEVPAALAGGALSAPSAAQRNNFSLTPITSQEGVELLEANYFLVQNANNTGAATTAPGYSPSATASPTSTSTTPPAATFTGAASKLGALVPVLGVGAFALLLL